MTRTLLITAAAVLALAASAGAANVLVNRNFEDPVHTTGWNLNTVGVEQYPNAWMAPGPCPADPNGPWGLQLVNNYGISDGNATQRVYMTGEYTLKASGWFRLYSGVGQGVSTAELRLLVDSTVVRSEVINGINGAWTDWIKIELPEWTGYVTTSVRLRPVFHVDGQGGWGQVVADQFKLDAVLIPEPTSILAVCCGLGGLWLKRRR